MTAMAGGDLSTDVLVIGLGYVGMPLAREAAISGLCVTGFDVNQAVVGRLNSGVSHVGDLPDADLER
jgi:UDP-N-acetyl-D-glucosamine dehydrogenase